MGNILKVNVLFTTSTAEAIGLEKFGEMSSYDMDFYSRWVKFSAKLAVPGIMDLVADMTTEENKATRPNILSSTYHFGSIY